MTSGYYDYDAIAERLALVPGARAVLEVGVGTGLVLQHLARRRPDLALAGVDLTRAMLDIAATRLGPGVALHEQNVVHLDLADCFECAFSYGGVWYFVPEDGARGFSLVSHLRDAHDNQRGLERLAEHLPAGGTLLLGVQSPHRDYERAISNGMLYAQRIVGIDDGFRKHYQLTDGGKVVMDQTTDYRTYGFTEALDLLNKCGFDLRPTPSALFLEFGKR